MVRRMVTFLSIGTTGGGFVFCSIAFFFFPSSGSSFFLGCRRRLKIGDGSNLRTAAASWPSPALGGGTFVFGPGESLGEAFDEDEYRSNCWVSGLRIRRQRPLIAMAVNVWGDKFVPSLDRNSGMRWSCQSLNILGVNLGPPWFQHTLEITINLHNTARNGYKQLLQPTINYICEEA